MRIRTQLALAFLLLAILPLTGIVLYSYLSSLRAVRQATEAEARTLTREMEGRLAAIRGELGRGVERIGELPVQALLSAARAREEGKADPLLGRMLLGFGEAVPFLDTVEVVPSPPLPESHPAPPETESPVEPPKWPGAEGVVVIDVAAAVREAKAAAQADPQVFAC